MPDYSKYSFNVPQNWAGGTWSGNWTGSAEGKPNPADLPTYSGSTDAVDWDPVRAIYINSRTKQPYTGKSPQTGYYISNGRVTAPPPGVSTPGIDPNNVQQRYKAVSIPKQPDVSAETSDLLTTFKKQADASLQDFSSYLNDFKKNLGTAQTAAAAASSPATVGKEAADMQAQQRQYAQSLDASQKALADLNAQTAAQEQGAVAQAQGLLPSYDAAAQAIADRQMQAVVGNLSRYKMGTGTPTSAGSDESRILANAASDVYLPLERDKINKQYDIISNLQLPVTRDIAGRETSRIAQFDPMVAGQKFQSGIATDKDVQALRDQVRNMTYEDAVRFMQAAQIPVSIQQAILSGNIGQLGQLSQLETASNYQGLQDLLGANITPATYYNQQFPGGFPSRYPSTAGTGTGGGGALSAPNAPRAVGPGGNTYDGSVYSPTWAGGMNYDPRTGRWIAPSRYAGVWDQSAGGYWDPNTGNFVPYAEPGAGNAAAPRTVTPGSMSNAYYDPSLGQIVDRTSGNFVPGGIQ